MSTTPAHFERRLRDLQQRAAQLGFSLRALPSAPDDALIEMELRGREGQVITRSRYASQIAAAVAGGEALRDRARAQLQRMPAPRPGATHDGEPTQGEERGRQ